MVFPCVGVCGYPVRTECGNACGSQDLQTFFYYARLSFSALNDQHYDRPLFENGLPLKPYLTVVVDRGGV